ncbi:RNA-directed DNA polymerase, eukaryota, reverse transcriptase zinc-binding domain protein [Tanacetum coccineum]|uniref:RNA-directed DNA polymerase, eukaryota, reverse transcriptase zinc-binding domain protein n=1 Tax=Tanacetum coccineum TaxID=301880 RepID=A0ABQ5E7T1_9ASTR
MIKLMESLNYKISLANRSLHINAKAAALKLVKDFDVAMGWERRKAEVDLFILSKRPLIDDIKDVWTDDMMEYFLDRCEEVKNDEKNGHYTDDGVFDSMEEVGDDTSGSASFLSQNEVVNGMTNTSKQDELKLLISEEKVNMCAAIETQISKIFVNKVGDYVFDNWSWVSNSVNCNRGCRIMVGWDRNIMGANLISQSDQVMHFEVVLGDFNVTLNVKESSNSFGVIDKDMDIFRKVLSDPSLDDIISYGIFLASYDSSFAKFLPYMTSDHCPTIIVYPDIKSAKPKSFRFMNFLADKHDFLANVKNNWGVEVQGFKMFVLAKRLKIMKRYMRNLNRINGNVFDKVKALRVELKRVQVSLDKEPDNVHLREEEYVYCNAYKEAMCDEEKVLRQKMKIQWLKDGNQNSAYFHNMLKGRVHKSRIEVVFDSQGNKYEGDDIASKFVNHFQSFLGSEDKVFPIDDLDSLFVNKLDSQCADLMVRRVMDEEIKYAMFCIEDDKAAGPDGFSSKFFKAAWSIVGPDVCFAVKEFFYSCKLLGEFNANLISLVPKLATLLKITYYRPISCCNVVYKCISKVIVNRLKEGLSSIVDCNQSAFIPGRHISDKILLAQEFMNGYDCNGGAQSSMIKWIMVCLTTASFSICVNGEIHGFFKGKRDLRQGDPMSPYLFTIVIEVFNLMVKRQISLDDIFKYHWGCSRIKLTHLCFADDLLMLCHGDHISACILRRALDEFSMSSGLYPNMAKSVPLTAKKLSIADCRVLTEKFLPKEQGGLGLKSLKVMNHSLMVKHLWNIASKKDSLWVKWLNGYRIKGNCVWNMKVKKNFSWNLKQILSLRDSIRRNVGYKIGNRKGYFIWYDRWHSNRPLSRLISDHVVKSNGFDLNAKVADFIGEYGWNWPSGWIVSFKDVVDVPVPVLDQYSVDKALWFNKQNEEVCFSVKEAWKVLRSDAPKVLWLKTQDRISRWFNDDNMSIIQWLVFAAAVYFVWQERNFRLFRKIERTADRVFDIIMDTVRLRLMGLNIKRSCKVDKVAATWNLTIKDVGVQGVSSVKYNLEHNFGEVGWGGFGFQFWVGVIRECRVEKSNDPVLTHRLCRVRWFFLSLRDSQSFLYSVYALTWFPYFDPIGSGGIRVFSMCSDKILLSRLSLVDSGFIRISPREGCKPGLDVSLWIILGMVLLIMVLLGWGFLGIEVLGFYIIMQGLISLSFGQVSGSSTGFWKCTTIYIIDKGLRLGWFNYWSAGCLFSVSFFKSFRYGLNGILECLNVQVIKVICMLPEVYKGSAKFKVQKLFVVVYGMLACVSSMIGSFRFSIFEDLWLVAKCEQENISVSNHDPNLIPPPKKVESILKPKKTTRTMNPETGDTMKLRSMLASYMDEEGFEEGNLKSGGDGNGVCAFKDGVSKARSVSDLDEAELIFGSVCKDPKSTSGSVSNFEVEDQNSARRGLSNNGGLRQSVSFASAVAKSFGGFRNNKLKFMSTAMNDERREVAVMDPVLEEGIDKWSMTVVGNFMGFQMGYREIVGHLKRMWRLYQSEEWEPGLCMSKLDTSKLPLWVKIYDIPLEAWNVEGISRIASRIGVLIIMDKITTSIFEKPYGRASYARVLVEVDVAKGLVDSVEIWYKGLGKSMILNVEYVWRPSLCDHCKMFGHHVRICSKSQGNAVKNVNGDGTGMGSASVGNMGKEQDGWQYVDNKRGSRNVGNSYQRGSYNGYTRDGMGYRNRGGYNGRSQNSSVGIGVKESSTKYVPVKSKDNVVRSKKVAGEKEINGKSNDINMKESSPKKDISTQNRFDVLNEDIKDEDLDDWEDVRFQVLSTCNTGIPIADEVSSKWVIKLLESLHSRIAQLKDHCHENARRIALQLVKETDEATGVKSDKGLFDKYYDQTCRETNHKVKELKWDKRRFEVDLFMLSKRESSNEVKLAWTEEMIEYFAERCEEIINDEKNGHYTDDDAYNMEEVDDDSSGSANFISQNEAVNGIETSMAQMQGGLANHPLNFQ